MEHDNLNISLGKFNRTYAQFFPKGAEGTDLEDAYQLARKKIWEIRISACACVASIFPIAYLFVTIFGTQNQWITSPLVAVVLTIIALYTSQLTHKYWLVENDILSARLEGFVAGMRRCGLDPSIDPGKEGQAGEKALKPFPTPQFKPSRYASVSKMQQLMQWATQHVTTVPGSYIQLTPGFQVPPTSQTEEQRKYLDFIAGARTLELELYKQIGNLSKQVAIIFVGTLIVEIPLLIFLQIWWVDVLCLGGFAIGFVELFRIGPKAKLYVQTLIVQGKIPLTKINCAAIHDALNICMKIRAGKNQEKRQKLR
ncbi:MAG TPA: hypothetical protein VKK79_06495 [Candidatus Lokiarchaeia archaeon]|nr:hypothetical protein [Candidatus Lokiarchaeia archaeon]